MLVGAFACAHTPQLLSRPETEDCDLVLRVHAAFARVKRRLTTQRPDAIAVVALLYTQDAPLDYAFYVPLHFTMPEPSVPLVPLHVNVYLPPQPTPRRCYEWGRALGEILRARPERVVLMASGGMSHFPGTDRYASPEFDYDRRLLDLLAAGRGRELAAITAEELDKAGNIELRTWLTLLGAVGDATADVYCYEPSWHHGNAVVEWLL